MSKFVPLVLALFLIAGLSGCAGEKAAPKAVLTEDTGAIEGIVVDDEQVVVPSAAVGLKMDGNQSQRQTTTSAAGAFAFPNLAPGSYLVLVQSPFFGPSSTKANVVVGEVTRIAILLKRIPSENQSEALLMDPSIQKGFINLAYSFPWTSGDTLGGSLGQGAPNEKSHFPLEFKKGLPHKEVVVEVVWQPGTGGSGTALQVLICAKLPVQDHQNNCFGFGPNPDYVSDRVEGPSPLVLRVSDLPFKEVEAFEVMVGDGGFTTSNPRAPITAQQSFDLYVTHCYYQNCTADHQQRPA